MARIRCTAFGLTQEAELPYSVFFRRESFTIAGLCKELAMALPRKATLTGLSVHS